MLTLSLIDQISFPGLTLLSQLRHLLLNQCLVAENNVVHNPNNCFTNARRLLASLLLSYLSGTENCRECE